MEKAIIIARCSTNENKQEQSIRNIMKLTGKSSGTVQKVKRLVL